MSVKHAVIIGGSISGLAAARVLSARFDRVTIVDRDCLLDDESHRAGVPQGRHGHGLLASGFRALEYLFPGLERELVNRGAIAGDVIGEVRWFQHGYYKAKFSSGLNGMLFSRPLLEATLRRLVREIPNVAILHKTHVQQLIATRDRRRIVGVQLKDDTGVRVVDDAALVIDAAGRASRSPEWLEGLGYEAPRVDEVHVGLGYTSRTFRRSAGDLSGDMAVIVGATPPHQTRMGFLMAMEGDRWIASLCGMRGDHAPTDAQGFEAFAASLVRPDIYEVVRRAEPLTDAVSYAFPTSLRRHYERLTRFPAGYLVMGDAICSFNPFYGQGMSVAALEALALEECLVEHQSLDGVWRQFFRAVSRIADTPWTIAAGSDFAFDGVTGPKPAGTDVINWYLARVHRAASADRVVCRSFFDVANLLKPPAALFAPNIVGRVIKECFWPSASSRPARTDVRQAPV